MKPLSIASFVCTLLFISSAFALADYDNFSHDSMFYINRGKKFLDAGNLNQAIKDFETAKGYSTDLILPNDWLGIAKMQDEDFDGALVEYNLAIKNLTDQNARTPVKDFNSLMSVLYSRRANVYLSQKKYDLAITDCQKSIRLKPNAPAQNFCGAANRELYRFDTALEYFNAAIQSDPNLTTTWSGRGRTYVDMGRYSEALSDCNKSRQVNAKSVGARLCFAELYEAQGNTSAAIQSYQSVLPLAPLSRDVRNSLAHLSTNPILKEKRVALVVGNNAYKKSRPLETAVNDANDMEAALKKLGFEVLKDTDVDIDGFDILFNRFIRRAKDADVALVYYSGHGFQYKDSNYLVPIENNVDWEGASPGDDINPNGHFFKPTGHIGFNRYINIQARADELKDIGKTRILIIDACRVDPGFETVEKRFGADVKPLNPAEGMFIAYASSPDRFSYDGDSTRNSPFTTALLKNLSERGLELRELFVRVRREAYSLSDQKQLSQAWDNMPNEFRFFPAAAEYFNP